MKLVKLVFGGFGYGGADNQRLNVDFFSIDDPTVAVDGSGAQGFRGNNSGVGSLETSGVVSSSWSATTTTGSETAAKLLPSMRSSCDCVVFVVAASLISIGATNSGFETLWGGIWVKSTPETHVRL